MSPDEAAAEFWADHSSAAELEPGARIVDPLQSDVWDHLIQVDRVGDVDPDGMVTIEGRRGSGAPCQVRVAEDWPVQPWTSELALFDAELLDAEHRHHLGTAWPGIPPSTPAHRRPEPRRRTPNRQQRSDTVARRWPDAAQFRTSDDAGVRRRDRRVDPRP
jgi:hypothetical protein